MTIAEREIGMADDAGAMPGLAVDAAGAHGGHTIDELGLANGAQLFEACCAIHRAGLHIHGRNDVVAAARIRQQLIQQVAPPRAVPQMVVRIDDRQLGLEDGAWVRLEVARGKGACRLRVKLTDATPLNVVNTGMGWWLPSDPAPEHGALDVNINAALAYDGPWDPVSGSSDVRGLPCRVEPIVG